MIYYLNFGLVLEQALVDIVKRYFDRLQLDDVYDNFHISVVNEHPFAHMIFENNARASDNFPSIVITTQSELKVPEMTNLSPSTLGIGLSSKDIDDYIQQQYRVKTKVNDEGEIVPVEKKGEVVKEKIPGFIVTIDDASIERLKNIADSRTTEETVGCVYGVKVITRRRDRMSIEIWAENNQLKNELYEQLRIMLITSLNYELAHKYKFFDASIFDGSVNGERSSNYNFDFDVILSGSHLSLEIDYNVCSMILDTDIQTLNKNIVTEVFNHAKT